LNTIKKYESCDIYLKNTSILFYSSNLEKYKEISNIIKVKKYPVLIDDIPQIENDSNLKIRVRILKF
jgi:hypothetical protein